ncbi:hypothetical protein AAVH_27581 [Aphelenchoides avenae]|nr:hypothetical protein AAVH_27581 [Aphelenchus avenae]
MEPTVLGTNEAEVGEPEAEQKCVALGGHLASLGDWDETYAARLAVRNAGLPRVHLGMRYNFTADGKRAPGHGYDGTLFEFRFPENNESRYPWCKGEPRGETITPGTSVVMHRKEGDSETCWGELPPPGNAAALCKRSVQ